MTTRTEATSALLDVLTEALPEAGALVTLGQATDGTACPRDEIGPIAHHIVGPTAAIRPSWHVSHRGLVPVDRHRLWKSHERTLAATETLVRAASGLPVESPIRCACPPDTPRPSPLVTTTEWTGQCAVARPPTDGGEVERIIWGGDPETVGELDGRLGALMTLADRARAVAGGELDGYARGAVEVLVRCLAGRRRWAIPPGWDGLAVPWRWPIEWQYGHTGTRAHVFLLNDELAPVILARLVDGRPRPTTPPSRAARRSVGAALIPPGVNARSLRSESGSADRTGSVPWSRAARSR